MALEVKNLKVKIDEKEVLKGINLTIKPGEVVALMGPNGSGKSSLAYTLMGHPNYQVVEEKNLSINLDGVEMMEKTPDERARAGLFLAFQYPISISGVTIREMLLAVLRERNKEIKVSALELKKRLEEEARELAMKEELLSRDINEGFSGGEKKKMEILQMRVLAPRYAIMDETDSGLDIDALKIVAEGARYMARSKNTGILVITHYQRILKYLEPDRVIVLKDGVIVDEGRNEVVEKLEKEGYKAYG